MLLPSPAYAFSDSTFFIHQDHLGSVIAVSDEQGNIVQQSKYQPYGSLAMEQLNNGAIGETVVTERSYTGQVHDSTTTLSYYNARYYDSAISRFISADSVQGGNRFAYVSGNPIMASDPTGNLQSTDPEISDIPHSQRQYNLMNYWDSQPSYAMPPIMDAETAGIVSGGSCAFGFTPGCYALGGLMMGAVSDQVIYGNYTSPLNQAANVGASTYMVGSLLNAGGQAVSSSFDWLKNKLGKRDDALTIILEQHRKEGITPKIVKNIIDDSSPIPGHPISKGAILGYADPYAKEYLLVKIGQPYDVVHAAHEAAHVRLGPKIENSIVFKLMVEGYGYDDAYMFAVAQLEYRAEIIGFRELQMTQGVTQDSISYALKRLLVSERNLGKVSNGLSR